MRDARCCEARSKRTGRRCQSRCIELPDGSLTRHCWHHGGKQEALPPGDPERGGRPPIHGFYSQLFREESDRALYEAFLGDITNLDRQIALAETNLVRFLGRFEAGERNGIPTSVGNGGTSVSIESYDRIVRAYLDTIGMLRERKARIARLEQAPPIDDDLESYEKWVAAVRSRLVPPSDSPSES
jgi:hypothetical protein